MRDFFARIGILGELLQFLWMRRLYWLIPMIVMLIIVAVAFLISNAAGAGSLMYTLW
jgi:hypothetical protein